MDTETYLPWTWAFIVWDLGQVICIWSTHLPWIWAFIVWDLGRVICIWPTHLKACLFIPLHRASLSIQITCSLEHKHTGSASKENKYRRTDKHTYKHRDTWSASKENKYRETPGRMWTFMCDANSDIYINSAPPRPLKERIQKKIILFQKS